MKHSVLAKEVDLVFQRSLSTTNKFCSNKDTLQFKCKIKTKFYHLPTAQQFTIYLGEDSVFNILISCRS